MTAQDIAVVGDNEPVQRALISAGIACLIIAQGAPVRNTLRVPLLNMVFVSFPRCLMPMGLAGGSTSRCQPEK